MGLDQPVVGSQIWMEGIRQTPFFFFTFTTFFFFHFSPLLLLPTPFIILLFGFYVIRLDYLGLVCLFRVCIYAITCYLSVCLYPLKQAVLLGSW